MLNLPHFVRAEALHSVCPRVLRGQRASSGSKSTRYLFSQNHVVAGFWKFFQRFLFRWFFIVMRRWRHCLCEIWLKNKPPLPQIFPRPALLYHVRVPVELSLLSPNIISLNLILQRLIQTPLLHPHSSPYPHLRLSRFHCCCALLFEPASRWRKNRIKTSKCQNLESTISAHST